MNDARRHDDCAAVECRRIGYDRSTVRLLVVDCLCDHTERIQVAGRISEPGVFRAACRAANVVAAWLERVGDQVVLRLSYGPDWCDEDVELAPLHSRQAWRHVPPDLHDDFAALLDDEDREDQEALAYEREIDATYRRQQGY